MAESRNGMLFFDVDGTLIDCPNRIYKPTAQTEAALHRLKDKGFDMVLASGRPRCFIDPAIISIGFDGLITSNGAYVEYKGRAVSSHTISRSVLTDIDEDSREYGFEYHLEDQDRIYVKKHKGGRLDWFFKEYGLPARVQVLKWDMGKADVNKMSVYLPEDESCIDLLRRKYDEFEFQNTDNRVYDVYLKKVTKATGVRSIVLRSGVDYYQTYAFGDGINDIEMMQSVYYSVAMGNCNEKLLKFTKFRTGSVAEEGIFRYLENNRLI